VDGKKRHTNSQGPVEKPGSLVQVNMQTKETGAPRRRVARRGRFIVMVGGRITAGVDRLALNKYHCPKGHTAHHEKGEQKHRSSISQDVSRHGSQYTAGQCRRQGDACLAKARQQPSDMLSSGVLRKALPKFTGCGAAASCRMVFPLYRSACELGLSPQTGAQVI
jgi:hypothetical protein